MVQFFLSPKKALKVAKLRKSQFFYGRSNIIAVIGYFAVIGSQIQVKCCRITNIFSCCTEFKFPVDWKSFLTNFFMFNLQEKVQTFNLLLIFSLKIYFSYQKTVLKVAQPKKSQQYPQLPRGVYQNISFEVQKKRMCNLLQSWRKTLYTLGISK